MSISMKKVADYLATHKEGMQISLLIRFQRQMRIKVQIPSTCFLKKQLGRKNN